mgnify:CR=1 FL=1
MVHKEADKEHSDMIWGYLKNMLLKSRDIWPSSTAPGVSANRPRISTGHGGHRARSDLHGNSRLPLKGSLTSARNLKIDNLPWGFLIRFEPSFF